MSHGSCFGDRGIASSVFGVYLLASGFAQTISATA